MDEELQTAILLPAQSASSFICAFVRSNRCRAFFLEVDRHICRDLSCLFIEDAPRSLFCTFFDGDSGGDGNPHNDRDCRGPLALRRCPRTGREDGIPEKHRSRRKTARTSSCWLTDHNHWDHRSQLYPAPYSAVGDNSCRRRFFRGTIERRKRRISAKVANQEGNTGAALWSDRHHRCNDAGRATVAHPCELIPKTSCDLL